MFLLSIDVSEIETEAARVRRPLLGVHRGTANGANGRDKSHRERISTVGSERIIIATVEWHRKN